MDPRKSIKRSVPSFFRPPQRLSGVSEDDPVLEGAQEQQEEVPRQAVEMLAAPTNSRPTPSRLQRLSSYLPSLKTSKTENTEKKGSKLSKDVVRKPVPTQYQTPQLTTTTMFSSPTYAPASNPMNLSFADTQAAPSSSRLTKAAPSSESTNTPLESPHNRLRKATPTDNETPYSAYGNLPVIPPPIDRQEIGHERSTSSPLSSRPTSYSDNEGGNKLKSHRKSWMPGAGRRNKNASGDRGNTYTAWVIAGDSKFEYNIEPLLNGEIVPELWDDRGDVYVYLFPQGSGRGPSFKIPSLVISSSEKLIQILIGDNIYGKGQGKAFDNRESMSINSHEEAAQVMRNFATQSVVSPPYTPPTSLSEGPMSEDSTGSIQSFGDAQPTEKHLYFPIHEIVFGLAHDEVQSRIDARNLFAFMTAQPLVATRKYPSLFQILLSIAANLKQLEFTNRDGSTYGEAAYASTEFFLEEQQLADVRHSREATLEGVILGEALRSTKLYNESYAHAVGKWDALQAMNTSLLKELPTLTRTRLEISSRELKSRVQTVNERLTDFEYPSLFAGIGSSTTVAEAKMVNFKNWKSNYFAIRKFVHGYYRAHYGYWPPKASKKRHTEGGLNRLVLQKMYEDFSKLYDYLVDRKSLTTRNINNSGKKDDRVVAVALRKLLGEFDNSSPPVQPPIPFDVPLIPTMVTVDPKHEQRGPKERNKANTRKLKDHELLLIMARSHGPGTEVESTQVESTKVESTFLSMFKSFEEKESKGKTVEELVEQRCGHWIFIYAVLQSLPLLVVDAPGLHFTEGVEYFLCQPATGISPWKEANAGGVQMSLYEVKGTGEYSYLPDDMVLHGVEATFRRTHCWEMATKWIEADSDSQSSTARLSPLLPPPSFGNLDSEVGLAYRPSVRSRNRSQSFGNEQDDKITPAPKLRSHSANRVSRQQRKRDSITLGLEKCDVWPSSTSEPYTGSFGGSTPTSRSGSPMYGRGGRRDSSMGGSSIESRPGSSTSNTGATFDDILGNMPANDVDKKGKKK